MKKIINICIVLVSVIFIQSCEENFTDVDSSFQYVSFESSTYSAGVDPGASKTIDLNVYMSTTASSDRTFDISSEGSTAPSGSFSVPSSVTVPSGTNKGTFSVQLNDVNLDCFNDVVLSVSPPEGVNPGPNTTLTFFQNPSETCSSEVTGTLDFQFDGYASEVSYQILDVLGGVVASGPEASWADGTPSASIPVTLCSGRCYTLVVNDAYGDGLSSPGGSYTLTVGGEVYATDSDDYGESSSTGFQVN